MNTTAFFDEMTKIAMSFNKPLMQSFFSMERFAKAHAPVGTKSRLGVLRSNVKRAIKSNDSKLLNSYHNELSGITKNISKSKGIQAPASFNSGSTSISPIRVSNPIPSLQSTTSFAKGMPRSSRSPSMTLGSWR